jgi:hypothetical protein
MPGEVEFIDISLQEFQKIKNAQRNLFLALSIEEKIDIV